MQNDKEPQLFKARRFPLAIGAMASVFFFSIHFFVSESAIFISLAELTLTMVIFFGLIVWFNVQTNFILQTKSEKSEEDNIPDEQPPTPDKPQKPKKNSEFKKFLAAFKTNKKAKKTEAIEIDTTESTPPSHPDGLIEIKKQNIKKPDNNKKDTSLRVSIAEYLLFFMALLTWNIYRLFATLPLSYAAYYRYSILDAVLLLIFPCVAAIYLKMRKDNGSLPGDKTSQDMLTLFSYASLICAAAITATAVLNVNFLIVPRLVIYAVSVYLIIALSVNILFSILKNNILGDFNYTIIPKLRGNNNDLLDSNDLKLNFSLKSLYTITYTIKILPGLILALGFIMFISTTIFVVHPHQQAAVYRFGRLSPDSIVGEGIHFKLPWPIGTVDIYDVHRISAMQVGFEAATSHHNSGEFVLLLGNGNEMVAVNITIVYNISDLYAFIINSANSEAILYAAAYEALLRRTASSTLDAFLSVDRSSLSDSISDELSHFSASRGLGLSVVEVIIESIRPPIEVADVYQRVVTASLERNTIITNAETRAARMLINAEQQSTTAVNDANARQYSRVSGAQGEMAVFNAAIGAYMINPESFRFVRTMDTFEIVVGRSVVYVFSPEMEDGISNAVLRQISAVNPWSY